MNKPAADPPPEYDPVFVNSRREALIIFCLWVAMLLWSVPVCYALGYGHSGGSVSTIWGIPTWLFWGIFLPWFVADLFTIWFCFAYMKDDDLGEEGAADGGSDSQEGQA